jgi:hypothetical protein
MSKKTEPLKAGSRAIELSLPIAGPKKDAYVSNHVEAQLTSRQALAMRMLLDGLHATGAMVDTGRYVTSSSAVVRYVLTQVADAAGIPG